MDAIEWDTLLHTSLFFLFALVACASALAVVVSGNIVRMAFYLVISLGAVAGLFFLAGADFVGAIQLMVYVGGTVVLLAFGVMLTARGPFVSMNIGRGQWVLAVIVGGSLLVVLLRAAMGVPDWTGRPFARQRVETPPTATRLGLGLLGVRVDRHEQQNGVLRRGMSGYLLAFEIVSVHLVVVLIGAAYLARAQKRVPTPAARNSPEASGNSPTTATVKTENTNH